MVKDSPAAWEKKFLPRNTLLRTQPQRLRSLYPRVTEGIERQLRTNPQFLIPKFIERHNYYGIYAIWLVRPAPYTSSCLYVGKATKTRVSDRLRNHCESANNPRLRGLVALKNGKLKFTTTDFSNIPVPGDFTPSDFIGVFEDYFIWRFATETNIKRKWK